MRYPLLYTGCPMFLRPNPHCGFCGFGGFYPRLREGFCASTGRGTGVQTDCEGRFLLIGVLSPQRPPPRGFAAPRGALRAPWASRPP